LAAKRVMRMKKARVPAEVAAEVKASMPDATEEQLAAETKRRVESLKACGLLLEQWGLDEIHADLMRCGLAGSPTKVYRVQSIVLTKEGFTEVAPTSAGIGQMVHELVVDRTWG
jgi:electron transfer flavoprotein beta subunit